MVGAISNILSAQNKKTKLYAYFSGSLNIDFSVGGIIRPLSIERVMSNAKASGFRTIAVFAN
jgi:hypothetical protein